jgi:hypothetical protein
MLLGAESFGRSSERCDALAKTAAPPKIHEVP